MCIILKIMSGYFHIIFTFLFLTNCCLGGTIFWGRCITWQLCYAVLIRRSSTALISRTHPARRHFVGKVLYADVLDQYAKVAPGPSEAGPRSRQCSAFRPFVPATKAWRSHSFVAGKNGRMAEHCLGRCRVQPVYCKIGPTFFNNLYQFATVCNILQQFCVVLQKCKLLQNVAKMRKTCCNLFCNKFATLCNLLRRFEFV